MIQKFLKDKKKVGMLIVLVIILTVSGILYFKSGYKELKKNDTESIFVDDTETDKTAAGTNNDISKTTNTKKNSNTNNKELATIDKNKTIIVEIKGEVRKPDVYTLDENAIVKDLIDEAGGLTENADLNNINRAKKLQNHELVYIANKNNIQTDIQNPSPQTNISNQGGINKKVNINSATLEELKTLNGIGDSKAKTIIEYREKNGGFKTLEDIKNVTGIGEKMFEKIKEQIET